MTKDSGDLYYEYLLVYVDDCIIVSQKPQDVLRCLEERITVKHSMMLDLRQDFWVRVWEIMTLVAFALGTY